MGMSEEHKAKMAEGRQRARAKRVARLEAKRSDPTRRNVEVAPSLPPPKPPREPIRRAQADPLLGINDTDCCIDCNMERCVISGKPYCAHPKKCGLQAIDKVNPETMNRFNRARKVLAHAEIERQS